MDSYFKNKNIMLRKRIVYDDRVTYDGIFVYGSLVATRDLLGEKMIMCNDYYDFITKILTPHLGKLSQRRTTRYRKIMESGINNLIECGYIQKLELKDETVINTTPLYVCSDESEKKELNSIFKRIEEFSKVVNDDNLFFKTFSISISYEELVTITESYYKDMGKLLRLFLVITDGFYYSRWEEDEMLGKICRMSVKRLLVNMNEEPNDKNVKRICENGGYIQTLVSLNLICYIKGGQRISASDKCKIPLKHVSGEFDRHSNWYARPCHKNELIRAVSIRRGWDFESLERFVIDVNTKSNTFNTESEED